MNNRYLNDGGELEYDKAWRTLADLNDGYFGSVERVSYQNASSVDADSGVLGLLGSDSEDEVDPDVLGSKLLRASNSITTLLSKVRHNEEDEEHGLHLMKKHAALASKLSDEYAMQDPHYQQQWHDDILDICAAIQKAEA